MEIKSPAFVNEDFREKIIPATCRSQGIFKQEIVYDIRREKPDGNGELV